MLKNYRRNGIDESNLIFFAPSKVSGRCWIHHYKTYRQKRTAIFSGSRYATSISYSKSTKCFSGLPKNALELTQEMRLSAKHVVRWVTSMIRPTFLIWARKIVDLFSFALLLFLRSCSNVLTRKSPFGLFFGALLVMSSKINGLLSYWTFLL